MLNQYIDRGVYMDYRVFEKIENYWKNIEENYKRSKIESPIKFMKQQMIINDDFTACNITSLKTVIGEPDESYVLRYQMLFDGFERALVRLKSCYDSGTEPTSLYSLFWEEDLAEPEVFTIDYFQVLKTKCKSNVTPKELLKNKFINSMVSLDVNNNPVVKTVEAIADDYLRFFSAIELQQWLQSIEKDLDVIEASNKEFKNKVYAYVMKCLADNKLTVPLILISSKLFLPSKVNKDSVLNELNFKGELSGARGNKFKTSVRGVEVSGPFFHTKAKVVILK